MGVGRDSRHDCGTLTRFDFRIVRDRVRVDRKVECEEGSFPQVKIVVKSREVSSQG